MDEIVLNKFMLKSELQALSVDKSEDDVIRVERLLHSEVKSHQAQMSWPPNESELTPHKISSYIPHLLDVFLNVLISGHSLNSDKSKTERTLRLKESFGLVAFVLFQSVVKGICNNNEILKLINKYGHGISYELVEEIETESALKVISDQRENRIVIPTDFEEMERSTSVGIMVADNIDNLECMLSGSGTSHRVNSILLTEREPELNGKQNGEALDEPCTYSPRQQKRSAKDIYHQMS